MNHDRRGIHVAVLLVALLALLAAACGGDDGDSGSEANTDPDELGESANTEALCRAGFDAENPNGDEEDPVEPEYGGSLVYAVEAETDGWNASSNRWALSGLLIANTFFDTLAKVDKDGNFVPWLAESLDHNEDYTIWTISLREGVQFHDQSALTAEVVKQNLDTTRSAPLTQAALSNIDRVEVTGELTLEVIMHDPWVPFPQYLASQVGVVMAPAMFDDPDANQNPVGTGPFVFENWTPDNELVVVRNENYWMTDEFGNQLPYLDSIQFRPIPDPTQRRAALDAGDIQVMHTFTADQINDFRERAQDGGLVEYESCAWGEDEEFLIMFNSSIPPFDDQIAREAVSRAIDRDAVIANLFGDTFQVATGPFAPGSRWYSEPPGGPTETVYDPERARELAQEYEQKHGEPLSFTLRAPSSIQEALESQQLTQQYLEDVGIDVDLEQVEFAQYLTDAVLGNYQANIWRQFGAPDPDGEYVWWHPDNVKPQGQLSLNIARFSDQEIGEALDRARQSANPDERREAYAEVQRLFREHFYLGWSAHAFWAIAALPEVQDLVNWTNPEGIQGMPLVGGQHPLAQVWLSSEDS
jgi:peptide/nickel transport system substrate-binding protein